MRKSFLFAIAGVMASSSYALVKANTLSKAETMPAPAVGAPISESSAILTGSEVLPTSPSASLFRSGVTGFFQGQRASRVGDIVTIKINISDNAQFGNSTTRTRDGSQAAGINGLFGLTKILPNSIDPSKVIDTNSTSKSSGQGSIARNESIVMTVAAVVSNVLPNGNLVLRGNQEVKVNNELRQLQVTGIIRPQDVARDNTILHSQIAEARIGYGGRGQLTDAQKMRWGQKLIDAVSPF